MAFLISTQPSSQSVVPGQDTTFTIVGSSDVNPLSAAYTYQWYTSGATVAAIANQTSSSYTIDPFITNNGLGLIATTTLLTGAPATTFVQTLTSNLVILTVTEDVPPYDVQDVWPETGRERHTRLRLLGYI